MPSCKGERMSLHHLAHVRLFLTDAVHDRPDKCMQDLSKAPASRKHSDLDLAASPLIPSLR